MKARVLVVLPSVLLLSLPALAAESVRADLDGDGKPESIAVQWDVDKGGFSLQVGRASVRAKTDDLNEGELEVVDLDSGDKWKEIAVSTGQTDGDRRVFLYGFDGKTLKTLGEVKQSFTIVQGRGDKRPVATLAHDSRIQVLAADTSGRAGEELYLVKSSTGLLGWASGMDLADKTEGLPFAGCSLIRGVRLEASAGTRPARRASPACLWTVAPGTALAARAAGAAQGPSPSAWC